MATAKKSTAKKPAATARAAKTDATVLLQRDHADVKKLFKQYEKLADAEADGEERQALATQICQMLTVHATIEEEIFYPAARAAIDETDLVDEADVEHATAKDLIAQLEASSPEDDDHFDAKVKVLGEYVRHHVKEEQDELFPKLRRTALDMVVLGERMAARKHELAALFANPAATEDAMRRFIPIV